MEAVNGMKVFEVGEGEWYVAPSAEAAVAAAMDDQGYNRTREEMIADGLLFDDGPNELTDEDMGRLKYYDADDDERPVGASMTFLELLLRDAPTVAGHFASSNI